MQVQELAALTGTVPAAVAGRGAGRGSAGASRGGPYSGRGRTESAPTPRYTGSSVLAICDMFISGYVL